MTDHTSSHETISAFIDNEPFDPNALGQSLSTTEGRELLIDLIALRHLVATDATVAPHATTRVARTNWRTLGAVAAIVCLAVSGGYFAGHRTSAPVSAPRAEQAPAPTRVIDLKPGIDWHPTQGER
jgi:hypothetical protein